MPIGIEDFKKLRENNFYYVDKSLLIKELLDNRSEVSLFMRPRRFGKTLSLSMLRYYFEQMPVSDTNTDNNNLFKGLKIMEAGEKYTKHKGRYPVVNLSLKSAKQPDWNMAYDAMVNEIAKEFERHDDVLESARLLPDEKELFCRIRGKKAARIDYAMAMEFLTRCLKKVYRRNVIVLLDEYDVPLENAYFNGFYKQMTDFIRSFFESALKTNSSLEFAVITGCIVSAKAEPLGESPILLCRGNDFCRSHSESIFTGLNNPEMISILNVNYAEHFGFTQPEVEQLLEAYGISNKKGEVRRWYDGYVFGKTEVYNPWSVLNYTKTAAVDKNAFPKPYWANTSSNSIVRELVERADGSVRQEMEALIEGEVIEKPVHEEITYDEVYKSEENLWNFLFFTGYLKKKGERFDGETVYLELAIPNTEVKLIYRNTIMDWFQERIKKTDFSALYQAVLGKNVAVMEKELSGNLMETISFYDYKEDYYHGFLGGLLKMMDGYIIKSNRESGLGRSDLLLLSAPYEGKAIIIEIKIADTYAELGAKAKEALTQIEDRQYDAELKMEGYHTFILYGIAFYKKLCRVAVKE